MTMRSSNARGRGESGRTGAPPRKDFSGLYVNPTDEHGKPIENVLRTEFEESIQATLDAQGYDAEMDSATAMNAKITKAIGHAIDTVLPTTTKRKGIQREVSERTQDLYQQRSNTCDRAIPRNSEGDKEE